MKTCNGCKLTKEISEFDKDRGKKDGLRTICYVCTSERRKATYYQDVEVSRKRMRDYRLKDIESHRSKAREYYWKNRVKIRARHREAGYRVSRNSTIKCKYGITEDQFQKLVVLQQNKCAICLQPAEGVLRIDHDHNTENLRGLLCHKCNVALGLFSDNPEIIRRAAFYIESRVGYDARQDVA